METSLFICGFCFGILDLCSNSDYLRINYEKQKKTASKNMKRYCKECGVKIGKGKSFCQKCRRETTRYKRHCKQCGAEVGKGKSFCQKCRPKNLSISQLQENKSRKVREFQGRWAIVPKRISEGKILNEIARELKLSRQRIRQIVKKLGLSEKYREQRFPNVKNIVGSSVLRPF